MVPASSLRTRRAAVASLGAALAVATIALIVLVGWILDIEELKGAYGRITMKANAALALLLCAIGLWSRLRNFRTLGVCSASIAAAIGGLTLLQHLFGWDFGIDQLLFTEAAGAAATVSPNRMGPNASTSLMLAGIALILLFRGTPWAIRRAQWLAITGGVLAILAVAGYVYGAVQLYAIAQYTGIALHTALALLALNAGVLFSRADEGPMAVFVADGPAGTLLRNLAAPVILLPLMIGYVVLRGREAGLYDRGLTIALFAVSIIIVLGALLWHTARSIDSADASRRRAEQDRDHLLVRERQARDEAERASRVKDQFIAVLSHELRTPLNVMLGWARALETESSPERHARAAMIVARNGRLLARLVEDLLDVSRVSAGQFEISRQPLSFNAVVQTAVDALTPLARRKGLTVAAQVDTGIGIVSGDAERLQQIVSNLLSNAIKFTPAGGRVDVVTRCGEDTVALIVSDTGIGFDESFAAQLFQPFRQADSSFRREHGGLGLGLSIARHIAELHGGSLEGSSGGPGLGATFTLRLPAISPDVFVGAGPLDLPATATSELPSQLED